jgi:FkbM family methyltransferase
MTELQIRNFFATYSGDRHAELGQDIFVLALTDSKTQGYFVEFGAMDGVYASNTLLLERQYSWQGIVAEPARRFHAALAENRHCCIDHRAVTGRSGDRLDFKEVPAHPGLSTLLEHINSDGHAQRRASSNGDVYQVDTVTLCDLLAHYHAPRYIDYISADVEGAEVSVLQAFDWDQYEVAAWSIEHNNQGRARDRVFEILSQQGYVRLLTDKSKYDDWYVKEKLLN